MDRTQSLWQAVALLHREETGQDLVEYALVLALIALAVAAGMSTLAAGINSAFTKIANILSKYAS
jgi:pilus assembly protein Flp/PilA